MKRYAIDAILESPLVVRRERQSQRSEGVQYINGTLLRGAFAQLYLERHGQADVTFRRLFLDEEACRFGPLDPATRVFPLTANSCKRQPGFEDKGHGVVDLLAVLVRANLSGQPWVHMRCQAKKCGQEIKAHTGFWDLINGIPTEPKRRWRRSVAAHVGIDRRTDTAAESIFFTLAALEPEPPLEKDHVTPSLHGSLEAEDDAIDALRQLLLHDDNTLHIGHARTRGYGRIRITLAAELPPATTHWSEWSTELLASAGSKTFEPGRYFLFSLSVAAGAVFLDKLLRYTLDPAGMVPWLPPLPSPDANTSGILAPAKMFEGGHLRCVAAVAHHERLRGWNVAHGLPRQDEWAVCRGSVYAYLYEGPAPGLTALQERLRELQACGIGARRNEGFGRVMICDDFHVHFIPKENK